MATTADDNRQVSCRVTNSLFKYLKSLGYDVSPLSEELPYTEEYLENPLNWVTYSARELICQRAADLVKDDSVMFNVGLMTPKLKPLGGIEVMVKLLGKPKIAYEHVPKYASFFDKIFSFEVKIHGDNRATITMSKPDIYPVSKNSCYYAQGILVAIPTVWGLPPAEIHEKRCMCQTGAGNDEGEGEGHTKGCQYEVTWQTSSAWYSNIGNMILGRFDRRIVKNLESQFQSLDKKNSELILRNSQLSKVREIALAIDKLRTKDEVDRTVVELARDIPGVRFVYMLRGDDSKEYVTIPYYSKIRNKAITSALRVIGFDLEDVMGDKPDSGKFRFRISQSKIVQDFVKNPRVTADTSLARILDGILPKILCDSIQRIAGIDNIVAIPIIVDGDTWGSILFYLYDEVPQDILEMVGAHCVTAIKNVASIESLEQLNWELLESEESLNEAQRMGKIGNWEYDLTTQKIIWSDETFELYERDKALGPPSAEEEARYYAPEEAKRLREFSRLALEQGKEFRYDLTAKLPSGRTAYYNASMRPIKDYKGHVAKLFGTVQDITERKQAEETLHRSEDNFRRSMDDSPMGIRIVTAGGEVLYANRAILDIYGYDSIEELVATPTKSRYTPESYMEHQIRKEKRERGEHVPTTYEIGIVRKDGEVRYLEVLRKEVLWNDKTQFQVLYNDITERKQAEKLVLSLSKFPTENPNPVIRVTNEGEITFCNATGFQLLRTLKNNTNYTLSENWLKFMRETYKSGVSQTTEIEHELQTFLLNVVPIKDTNYLNIYGMNITELKKANEEIAYLASFAELNPNLVLELDQEGNIRYLNLASKGTFPDLTTLGLKHPFLLEWSQVVKELQSSNWAKTVIREVAVDSSVYEQVISPAPKNHIFIYSRDVTERKKAEEALRESEEKLRSIVENSSDQIFMLDKDYKLSSINKTAAELSRKSPQEMIGMSIFEMFPEDTAVRFSKNMKDVFDTGKNMLIEEEMLAQGRVLYNSTSLNPVKDVKGSVIAVTGIVRDMTERRLAEEALRKSEQYFKALFEHAGDSIYIMDMEGKHIVNCNNQASIELGYSREEILQLSPSDIEDILTPEEIAATHRRLKLEEAPIIQSRLKRKDGTTFPVEIRFGLLDPARPEFVISTVRNITERKQAEEELRHSRERSHHYATYLQDSIETEKKRLAGEIHDEVGQMLTALKIDLSWLLKRLPVESELLRQKSKAMLEMIDTTDSVLRRMSADLRPGLLDDLGLSVAVRWLLEQFKNRTGIECELVLVPDDISLDKDRSLAVFRIIQESLTNITRHANATKVGVSLKLEAANLAIEIQDNGRGVTNSELTGTKSFGLMGMRERAQHWGGDLSIRGVSGKGTTILVSIPASEEKSG